MKYIYIIREGLLETSADKIKAILNKAKDSDFLRVDKPRLTDEQAEQKANDIKIFFDKLTAKVEADLNEFISILSKGDIPLIKDMDDTINSFNHIRTINDAHNTYIPRHNAEDNLQVIRTYIATHYSQEMLERFDSALNGDNIESDVV